MTERAKIYLKEKGQCEAAENLEEEIANLSMTFEDSLVDAAVCGYLSGVLDGYSISETGKFM